MINKLLQAVIFLFFSANTFAHELHITAQYDGVEISGKAYYSDQTPAVDTYVEAVKPGETNPVVYGKTDREGRFNLPFNQEGTFNVIIEGMEGHRAEMQVTKMQAQVVCEKRSLSFEIRSTGEIFSAALVIFSVFSGRLLCLKQGRGNNAFI